MNQYLLGIDLGGTNIKIGLFNSQGEIIARHTQPTQVELGPHSAVERMGVVCFDLLDQSHLPREQLKAAGIGSPGPLSLTEGLIVKAGNLPGFDNFPLRSELSKQLHLPVVLDNDANAACWGEFWLGAGKDTNDMAMFTLGTGIGCGIVCAGRLLHGTEGNGAELGHMIIHPGGRQCTCGQRGCLEAYASATHTVARANEALDEGQPSAMLQTRRQNGSLTCKDVFDHAAAGDKLAGQIIDGTAYGLAIACVNIRHLTEPQRLVLAGGMIGSGQMLLARTRRFYEQNIWTLKDDPMDICLAQLGADAGIIGAAGLALHACRENLLKPLET